MKKNFKRASAFLLVFCMILGMFPMSVFADSEDMKIEFGPSTGNNFNFWGKLDNGSEIKTSYNNSGWATVLRVDGNKTVNSIGLNPAQITVGDDADKDWIKIETELKVIDGGTSGADSQYLRIKYTVTNNDSRPHTIDIATHADVMIGANDSASIIPIESNEKTIGLTMDGTKTDSSTGVKTNQYKFNLLLADKGGISGIDHWWVGQYGQRTSHLWDNVNIDTIEGVDSGMVFSFLNKPIQPGEILTFMTVGGVVDAENHAPSLTIQNFGITAPNQLVQPKDRISFSALFQDEDQGDYVNLWYNIDSKDDTMITENYSNKGSVSGSFILPSLSPGSHELKVWAQDQKGEMSQPESYTISVADILLDISQSPTGWTNQDVRLTIKTDGVNFPLNYIRSTSGESPKFVSRTSGTPTITSYDVGTNGTYFFEVTSPNSVVKEGNIQITNIDKIQPTLSVNKTGGLSSTDYKWYDATQTSVPSTTVSATDSGGSGLKSLAYSAKNSAGATLISEQPITDSSGNILFGNGSIPGDDRYEFIVTAEDYAGNKTSDTLKIGFDRAAPRISATAFNSLLWVKDSATFNVSATDATSGIKDFKYTLNGTTRSLTPTGDKIVVSGTGNYTVALNATDVAGNVFNDSRTVKVDDSTPSITSFQIQETDEFIQEPSISTFALRPSSALSTSYKTKVIVQAHDTGSGISKVEYSTNGKDYNPATMESSSSDKTDVTYYAIIDKDFDSSISFRVEDGVGHVGVFNVPQGTLIVDSANPVITITGDDNDWHNGNVSLTVSATDAASGLKMLYYSLDGKTTTLNTSGNNTITVSGSGEHQLMITAVDNASNISVAQRTIKIDVTDPVVDRTYIERDNAGNNILHIFANDAHSGVNSVEVNGTSVSKVESTNEYTYLIPGTSDSMEVQVFDNVGRASAKKTVVFDIVKPVITVNTDFNGWKTSDINVSAEVEEENLQSFKATYGSNVIDLQKNGVFTIAKEGNYPIVFEAEDMSGNTDKKEYTVKLDKTAPTVKLNNIDTSKNNAETARIYVDVEDKVSGINESSVVYSITGNTTADAWYAATKNNDNSWYVPIVGEWNGRVWVKASDNAGNTSYPIEIGGLNVDNTPPQIYVFEDTSWNNSAVTITVKAMDNDGGVGLSRIEYSIDGAEKEEINSEDARKGYSITISNEGIHNITFNAFDLSGNEASKTTYVNIDKTNPVITNHSFIGNDIWVGNRVFVNKLVTVNIDAYDELSGIKEVQYKLPNNTHWSLGTRDDNGLHFDIDGTVITGNIEVQVTDMAGNSNTTYKISDLVWDNVAPTIKVSTDKIPTWINKYTEEIKVPVTIQDSYSGVASTTVKVYNTSDVSSAVYEYTEDEAITAVQLDARELYNDGQYIVEVTATDNSKNSATESFILNVDKTDAELLDIKYISNETELDDALISKSKVEVRIYVDDENGIDAVYCDNVKLAKPVDKQYWTTKIDTDADRDYTFDIVDKAGNHYEYTSDNIIVDLQIPELSLDGEIYGWSNKDVVITATSKDTYLERLSYETDEPEEVRQHGSYGVDNNGSEMTKDITMRNNGIYGLEVLVTDKAGNEFSQYANIQIDKKAPTVTDIDMRIIELGNENVGQVKGEDIYMTRNGISVMVTVNDDDDEEYVETSGVKYIEYRTDSMPEDEWIKIYPYGDEFYFTYSEIYNGSLYVRATDNAGNISAVKSSKGIIIEKNPPVVKIEKIGEQWRNEPFNLNVSITDSDSDIDAAKLYYVAPDGDLIEEDIYDFDNYQYEVTESGEYTIYVIAVDNAGNATTESILVRLDTQGEWDAPSIDSNGYEFDTWTSSPVNIKLYYNDDQNTPVSGIEKYLLHSNDNTYEDNNGYFNFDKDGEYVINGSSVSISGLKSLTTDDQIIRIDMGKPIVNGLDISDGEYHNEPVKLVINASDEVSGIAGYEYRISGMTDWEQLNENVFTIDNEYVGNIFVRVVDNTGNYSDEYVVENLTLDMTNPTFTFDTVTESVINLKASEQVSANYGYIYFYNLKDQLVKDIFIDNNKIKINGDIVTVDIAGQLNPGEYKIVVASGLCKDNSGNPSNEYSTIIVIPGLDGKPLMINAVAEDTEGHKISEATLNKDERTYSIIIPEATEEFKIKPTFNLKYKEMSSSLGEVDNKGYITLNAKDIESGAEIIITADETVSTLIIYKAEYLVEIEISENSKMSVDESIVKSAIDVVDDINNGAQKIEIVISMETKTTEDIQTDAEIMSQHQLAQNEVLSDGFDISVAKVVDEETTTKITNLQKPIKITMEIPETLRGRTYYKIGRIHDGKLDILDATTGSNNTVIFESDRFSTYYIIAGPKRTYSSGGGGSKKQETEELEDQDTPRVDGHGVYCPSEQYDDLDVNAWYHNAADWGISRGYFTGTSDNAWSPDKTLTRAEAATVIGRIFKHEPAEIITSIYRDVSETHWAASYIEFNTTEGYMLGYGNDSFGPSDDLTREQFALTLYRIYADKDVTNEWATETRPDDSNISDWAYDAMVWAYNEGIINGNEAGDLMSKKAISRAEACTMFMRTMDLVNKSEDTNTEENLEETK